MFYYSKKTPQQFIEAMPLKVKELPAHKKNSPLSIGYKDKSNMHTTLYKRIAFLHHSLPFF